MPPLGAKNSNSNQPSRAAQLRFVRRTLERAAGGRDSSGLGNEGDVVCMASRL